MYTPDLFRLEDREQITALLRDYSFASLVSGDCDGALTATHIPFRYESAPGELGSLTAHMVRANPQWQDFANGRDVMVVFSGPHGYISPSWYADEPAVPTWNYAAAHAYGRPQIIEEDTAKRALLHQLIETSEVGFEKPWRYDDLEEYMAKMIRATVAFEININRLDAKANLGQNRSAGDKVGTATGLRSQGDDLSAALADLSERVDD